MPRAATYGRIWSERRGSSSTATSDEDDRPIPESDSFSSDLSELESESEYNPDTEDEDLVKNKPREHKFKLHENVWVKPRGCFEWFRGSVKKIRESHSSRGTKKRGTLYLVVFRRHHTNMRDIFSSTEGTIKPDTPRVRALVRMAS
ncbi:hypothetical protein BD311DRAFT_172382 [Dichomitus squalens]|uniref:Uncharacterized protein n=1 Tax=Dichomitus squalens TaxID=114155 RepID=A0A4Q9MWC0_9APHY|nr:hypothetical protein BD311DRAFT_172382 [Dichomitus squalens]